MICAVLVPALLPGQTAGVGQLDASYSLFTVLAAINAAGYDAELNSPSNHPLRAQIRQAVAAKNPPSVAALKQFYEAHKTDSPQRDLAQYVSYALSLQDPPSFKFRFDRQELPPDVMRLEGLAPLLVQFHKEADIETLWKKSQPAFQEILARYQPPVVEAVQKANLYLRNPTSGVANRRFQIWVDVLAAPNQVLRWTNVTDYVVVATASPELRVDDVRRAYLHYLIDPMMLRNAAKLEKKRPIQDLTQASPILDDIYKTDFTLLAGMCLVRAVEARLAPAAQRAGMVDRAMSEGFILTAYFYDALPGYEKDERAMRLYAGDMIDGIDLAKEDARIAKVQFVSQRATRTVKAPAPPEAAGGDGDPEGDRDGGEAVRAAGFEQGQGGVSGGAGGGGSRTGARAGVLWFGEDSAPRKRPGIGRGIV